MPRSADTGYGLAVMDRHGRLADLAVMVCLGWGAGTVLGLGAWDDCLVLAADPGGTVQVARDGTFRLPAGPRRQHGLAPGDRVLLAADPAAGRLRLYPPASLDELLRPSSNGAALATGGGS